MFCPTQDMIEDFFTKPLQGALFVRMREKMLNLPASQIATIHRSVLKDRKIEKKQDNVGRGTEAVNNATGIEGKIKMTSKQDWDTRLST